METRGTNNITDKGWLSLDNAAKIYPAVISRELTSVFRISCTLNSVIKVGTLQEAIKKVTGRFPYFNTTLRRGFFWYFLEYGEDVLPKLSGEEDQELTAFPAGSVTHALYRILAKGSRISVEFLHILSDGGGALEFFRTLLVCYFRMCGEDIPYSNGIIDPDSKVENEETEDSFKKYYNSYLPAPDKYSLSWHIPDLLSIPLQVSVTEFEVEVRQLKDISKSLGISITEYLASVYLYCLQEIQSEQKSSGIKPKETTIRLEVPINMRRLLPSKTMRNFSLFVMPEIDTGLGEYTFEEIVRVVYHYLRAQTDIKLIRRIITRNVKPEYNPVVRYMPIFIKNIVLTAAFYLHGSTKFASVMTNVGIIDMPEEAGHLIKSFSITPPPPTKKHKISCGIASYNNKMRIVFTNITDALTLERKIVQFLIKQNINVRLINRKIT